MCYTACRYDKVLMYMIAKEKFMYRFNCDYLEGAHPKILERLVATNMEQTVGYGFDEYTESAKEKIKAACECPDGEVYLLVGGTQTNSTVLSFLLKDYEGVISADTGHIAVHEAGAVELTGHKVITLPAEEGKLCAESVEKYLAGFYADATWIHMVHPGAIYISHPTEYGTLYAADELKALRAVCDRYGLKLFLDGARLGYALAAEGTDVTLPVIAKYCDAFYIGGTKVGAMFGEAVVFTKKEDAKHFFTVIKQHGALLAKGRLLGVQFDTLFTDDLYFEISRHAIRLAMKIKKAFLEKGYEMYLDSVSNQQFFMMSAEKLSSLEERGYILEDWGLQENGNHLVRIATSWATSEAAVDALLAEI